MINPEQYSWYLGLAYYAATQQRGDTTIGGCLVDAEGQIKIVRSSIYTVSEEGKIATNMLTGGALVASILNQAKLDDKIEDLSEYTLFLMVEPQAGETTAIVHSGIKKIVVHKEYNDLMHTIAFTGPEKQRRELRHTLGHHEIDLLEYSSDLIPLRVPVGALTARGGPFMSLSFLQP